MTVSTTALQGTSDLSRNTCLVSSTDDQEIVFHPPNIYGRPEQHSSITQKVIDAWLGIVDARKHELKNDSTLPPQNLFITLDLYCFNIQKPNQPMSCIESLPLYAVMKEENCFTLLLEDSNKRLRFSNHLEQCELLEYDTNLDLVKLIFGREPYFQNKEYVLQYDDQYVFSARMSLWRRNID
jgi:hypothetical protein